MDDTELREILSRYVTKEELEQIFLRQRTASEQFLEDHDRSFRLLEQQVAIAVSNLNAGLSKLSIMSDALSNVIRVQQDNYEAARITSRSHEDRLGRLEIGSSALGEELKNFVGSIFGDSERPDQESMLAMMRNRYAKADAQHEEIVTRFDHIEERQEKIEEQIERWRKVYTAIFQSFGQGIRTALPKVAKWAFGMFVAFVAARIGAPGLMNQLGETIKAILGLP